MSTTVVEQPGINPENISDLEAALAEALGEKWVSSDPAVLTAYSRDFTITPGNWPNVVVLPGSTEDVAEIIKIANRHQVPVVPMSTGFNHGGLCIPRRGGIMVDLIKRMDQVLAVDEESMTITIQPGVRNAVTYIASNKKWAVPGLRRLVPALPLTSGSTSTLSNYVARGGAATMLKHGNTPESIVSMTWVLPDGEVLVTGANAVPRVGVVPLPWGPGPDIAGMFINASGSFGICTEMTIKIFPEPVEEKFGVFDLEDPEDQPVEKVVDFFYKASRMDVCDFLYKTHGGAMANSSPDPDIDREDLAEAMGEHLIIAIVAGDTEKEREIKWEAVVAAAEESGFYEVVLEIFADYLGGVDKLGFVRGMRSRIGKDFGRVMGGKGSFQWTACNPKMEKIPETAAEYDLLLDKYWKPTDPNYPRKRTMAGTAIQGPYQFGRVGTLEYDYWWDPGNTETVKRATRMIQKATALNLKHKLPLWRNMYDSGEMHLPLLGTYWDLLKRAKRTFDPHNLMHPDVDPLTDDYI
ncbi:MAG: FAD-binding oxidoreductase [Deltaproteobacteria bacterium]|nr:FAD-binding oxidoreductase [Deltaproteobacteria bacterium]